jgi:hypothetical protein
MEFLNKTLNLSNQGAATFEVATTRRLVLEKNKSIVLSLRASAFLASLLNISVLSNSKLRKKNCLYKDLLIIAIIDASYSFMVLLLGLLAEACYSNDHSQCGPYMYYSFLVLYILLSECLTSSLAMLNILLEIFLTLRKIRFRGRSILRSISPERASISLFVLSALIYFPTVFMYKVKLIHVNNGSGFDYRLVKSEFGKSIAGVWIRISLKAFRIVSVLLVLSILNMVTVCIYQDFYNRTNTLRNLKSKP